MNSNYVKMFLLCLFLCSISFSQKDTTGSDEKETIVENDSENKSKSEEADEKKDTDQIQELDSVSSSTVQEV